ncbi:MAG: HYR domain-containing protein, partial [Blastocatellia bacterium]
LAATSSAVIKGVDGAVNDTLTVDLTGGPLSLPGGIHFDGGKDGFDTLVVKSNKVNTIVSSFLPDQDGHRGSISYDGVVIDYSGLEPITLAGNAADLIINLPTGDGNNQAALEDDAGAGNGFSQLRSQNGSFETTIFANPTTSLTINFGNDGEVVTIFQRDSLYAAMTNLVGGTGADFINLRNGQSLFNGTIDGGGGTDTLDYSNYSTSVSVNLGSSATSLDAKLESLQEVPPNTSIGSGTATVTYNNVTHTFDITVSVTDLNPLDVNGFHIHKAPTTVNGAIIVDLLPLAPLVPAGSGFTFTATGVSLDPLDEAALLGGITYVNAHTVACPNGIIRGQLYQAASVAAPGTATNTGGISNIEQILAGSGSDSLVGDLSANFIVGDSGNDTIVGSRGNDILFGGDNDDVIAWSNGDGTDIIDGVGGTDTVQVNGSVAAGDDFVVGLGPGGRIDFDRVNLGLFSLDIGGAEVLTVNGIGGNDIFTVRDLTGALALTTVNLNGGDGDDTFNVTPSPTATINVNGGAHTIGDAVNYNTQGQSVSTSSVNQATCSGNVVTTSIQRSGVQDVVARFIESIAFCSLTCPANITQSNDPNQCGAVVNYTAPAQGGCGTVTCAPAPGSFFPVGTTTVTCTEAAFMTTCTFTVTVNDAQPPSITCPANIATAAAVSCPIATSQIVTFPPPTASDNCPGVVTVCNPPSGSTFPVGTTTVTCTATDASGNTATCSFTVSAFSLCLQDETNPGNVVLFNTTTGEFRFCCNGVVIATGIGVLNIKGCQGTINDQKGDRRVQITFNTSAKNGRGAGTAFVAVGPNVPRCSITDKNMSDNTCTCQ